MALNKTIIRENATHARLIAGSGTNDELRQAMIGISTDRLQLLMRDPGSNTMYANMRVAVGGTVAGNIPFFGANDTPAVDNDLHWDNVNKRLGIGTQTADAPAHVYVAASGVAPTAGTGIFLESDADAYISIISGTFRTVGLYLGDTSDPTRAGLIYNHNLETLYVRYSGGDAITISAAGGIAIANALPISGGAAGLRLVNQAWNGCTVNTDGDLAMNAGEYFRTGQNAVAGTVADTTVLHNGVAALSDWLAMKDLAGVTYYFPGTSVAPE